MKVRPVLPASPLVEVVGRVVVLLVPAGVLRLSGVTRPSDATVALLRVSGSMEMGPSAGSSLEPRGA